MLVQIHQVSDHHSEHPIITIRWPRGIYIAILSLVLHPTYPTDNAVHLFSEVKPLQDWGFSKICPFFSGCEKAGKAVITGLCLMSIKLRTRGSSAGERHCLCYSVPNREKSKSTQSHRRRWNMMETTTKKGRLQQRLGNCCTYNWVKLVEGNSLDILFVLFFNLSAVSNTNILFVPHFVCWDVVTLHNHDTRLHVNPGITTGIAIIIWL